MEEMVIIGSAFSHFPRPFNEDVASWECDYPAADDVYKS